MRKINRLPLDDDIINRIFTFLPSFQALRSLVLVSKAFHAVYSAHPSFIIRSVAYSVAGPALPQLLQFVRYDRESSQTSAKTAPISPQEMKAIDANAQVARGLEDVFSLRHKDRASKSSRLTLEESWRFHRAVYHLMIFAAKWPGNTYTDPALNTQEHDIVAVLAGYENDKPQISKFFDDFSSEELREILVVGRFLAVLARWSFLVRSPDDDEASEASDFSLSAGPVLVYQSYTERDPQVFDDFFNWHEATYGLSDVDEDCLSGYLTEPVCKLLEDRKDELPAFDYSQFRAILDQIEGENDACTHCGKVNGLKLWGESNWHYMAGSTEFSAGSIFHGLFLKLRGELKSVNNVTSALQDAYWNLKGDFYETLMKDIFDLKTTKFTTWQSSDWLCDTCLAKLISAHLHLWILKQMRDAGETIPKDCWYGYNCRTQTHNSDHATKLNHLCEPKRAS